jgi:hypothetical protein
MKKWIPGLAIMGLLAVTPAAAGDWSGWAEIENIEVITAQEDGAELTTTIWIVVLDGTAYIRTSQGSGWGDAVEKAEAIGLRGGDELRSVSPIAITDAAARERIEAGFREKYGFQDAMIGVFRGDPRIWSVDTASD